MSVQWRFFESLYDVLAVGRRTLGWLDTVDAAAGSPRTTSSLGRLWGTRGNLGNLYLSARPRSSQISLRPRRAPPPPPPSLPDGCCKTGPVHVGGCTLAFSALPLHLIDHPWLDRTRPTAHNYLTILAIFPSPVPLFLERERSTTNVERKVFATTGTAPKLPLLFFSQPHSLRTSRQLARLETIQLEAAADATATPWERPSQKMEITRLPVFERRAERISPARRATTPSSQILCAPVLSHRPLVPHW
ncbi:hypothetical protein SCP_0313410 [Sparassis crispa]|uniref:Uncharacterized protein n=1 Tax=Sparassis crispa TaxID=139825 RepID=A0A401GHH3_9APHY|nr:hypothetical protein SCP_0313410 [Sparassis crispa]GBE81612.1 hypothetical protein SCP_0313410 [Sparassis crispa]